MYFVLYSRANTVASEWRKLSQSVCGVNRKSSDEYSLAFKFMYTRCRSHSNHRWNVLTKQFEIFGQSEWEVGCLSDFLFLIWVGNPAVTKCKTISYTLLIQLAVNVGLCERVHYLFRLPQKLRIWLMMLIVSWIMTFDFEMNVIPLYISPSFFFFFVMVACHHLPTKAKQETEKKKT